MSEHEFVVGIDLGGTKILSICVDRDLNILNQDKRETEAEGGIDVVVERMVESALAAGDGRAIAAAGVSTPGPSNPFTGVVSTPPNLPGWFDVPLARLISEKLGVPAWIENDANAGALAEHRLGAGRGTRHLVMVAAGTGIGGGLVLDGRLYGGASGGAGEVGHMQLDPLGRQCGCGRLGCLEALASGRTLNEEAQRIAMEQPEGLVARIAREEKDEPDARILDLAAAKGDEAAITVLKLAGTYLGAGLTNLINLFNPEVIAIGGSLRKSEIYMEAALACAQRDAFRQHAEDVRILEAELGDEAPAIGAAIIAWEKVEAKAG